MEKEFVWTDELVNEYANSLISPLQQIGRGLSNGFNNYSALEYFKASKRPKPLFTTEDGVEIFEGDRCWFVDLRDNKYEIDFYDFIRYSTNDEADLATHNFLRYFSTEEKAKEYMIINKPCISVSDVYNILTVSGFALIYENGTKMFVKCKELEERLKELAKQKING